MMVMMIKSTTKHTINYAYHRYSHATRPTPTQTPTSSTSLGEVASRAAKEVILDCTRARLKAGPMRSSWRVTKRLFSQRRQLKHLHSSSVLRCSWYSVREAPYSDRPEEARR